MPHPIVRKLLGAVDSKGMRIADAAISEAREGLLKQADPRAFLDLLVVWGRFDARSVQPLADQLLGLVRLFSELADADAETLRRHAKKEERRTSVTLPGASLGSVGIRKR
ncbi:MAG: hypothetical protein IT381_04160 [Deltaproteobacteria bacterium]|nr:hypothetical protein [Deltaproteobacteria bacterium]